jgi:hypothetical protein
MVMLTFRGCFESVPLDLVWTSVLIAAALQVFDFIPQIF